jgi:transcriptional regulator with XRE-family HTH domain
MKRAPRTALPKRPPPPADFVARLRRVITSYGTVVAMARRIGRSEGALRKWLRGESAPDVVDAHAMCEVAGFRVEWLVTGNEPPVTAADLVDFIAYTFYRRDCELRQEVCDWNSCEPQHREQRRQIAATAAYAWIETKRLTDKAPQARGRK